MKVVVILNGISRQKDFFYNIFLPPLQKEFEIDVRETRHAGHAEWLAEEAASQLADVVIAAGGDGTLHQVINGVLQSREPELPVIGLIPLGSGNDFARSVNSTRNPKRLIDLLQKFEPRLIDIGEAKLMDASQKEVTRYFANVCSLGMGPEVVRRIQQSSNRLGAGFTYLQGIVSTFLSLKAEPIHVQSSGWEWRGKARVFAMANGRAFGHGVYIAPDALLNDGRLNTFLAGDFPMWRFLLYLQSIKLGKKVKDANIQYGQGERFEVSTQNPMPVEAEGELIGYTPLQCSLQKSRIRFLY